MPEIILAIEAGVTSGSISLVKDGTEIDFWVGETSVSQSENLLFNIAKLLAKNGIHKTEIAKVAASRGPGSFTGVRVGITTAIALARALNCEYVPVNLLEAMALNTTSGENVVAAFGVGENDVCSQAFQIGTDNVEIKRRDLKTGSIEDFVNDLRKVEIKSLVITSELNAKLFKSFPLLNGQNVHSVRLIKNTAFEIGLRSEHVTLTKSVTPVYTRLTVIH